MSTYLVRCQSPAGQTAEVRVSARNEEHACAIAMRRLGSGYLPIWALEQ